MAAYEFPLWVALNFDTVDEAEKALRNVAIRSVALKDQNIDSSELIMV